MMFVVVCENDSGEPGIFAPFDSAEIADEWIAQIKDTCPNDHYWLEAETPIMFDIAESVAQ